jgi:hypothetical protein
MNDTTIGLSSATLKRLYELKGPKRTYNDFINQLLDLYEEVRK